MLLPHVVAEGARRFGDAPAIVAADGTPTSFRGLHEQVQAVAAGLVEEGVERGDVVVLRLPSTIDYVVAYVAAATLGAVTAGINPYLAAPEQEALVSLVEPALVLDEPGAVTELERPRARVSVVHGRPRDDVAVVFTSGTTGIPKGAVFTNAQLEAITTIDTGGRWGGGAPMLASTQFAHVGFMTKLPWYLMGGAPIFLLDRWRAGDVLRLVSEQCMPIIGAVAPQVALMLRAPESRTLDFGHVQALVVGAGPSSPALVAEARDIFDAAYSIRYSSTECGGCGTGTAFDADDHEALHTVGRPRAGIEVSIRGEDGAERAPGEVGEVCLRSGAVMDRYWGDAEATAATLRDGWLWSGDLGYLDERGLLVLAGRRKEMYIRGGYNVYPMEVESALADHPGVADCAVVPRPDDVMGEVGVVVVVPADPTHPPTLDDLRAHLAPRLARYKLPEAVRLVDALPLTPMQKIDRRALARG